MSTRDPIRNLSISLFPKHKSRRQRRLSSRQVGPMRGHATLPERIGLERSSLKIYLFPQRGKRCWLRLDRVAHAAVKGQTGQCGWSASKIRNLCCLRVRNKNSMDRSEEHTSE